MTYPKKIKFCGNLDFFQEGDYLGKIYGIYICNDDYKVKHYVDKRSAYKFAIEMTFIEKIRKIFFTIFK